jgi:hypothetical protein
METSGPVFLFSNFEEKQGKENLNRPETSAFAAQLLIDPDMVFVRYHIFLLLLSFTH